MKAEVRTTRQMRQPTICSFEKALAKYCVPVLLGKKPAALFSARCLPDKCPWQLLYKQGFKMVRLCRRNQSSLIFLYHPELLKMSLKNKATYSTLKDMGYPIRKNWKMLLGFLYQRFQNALSFPHEVRFFLGYPPEDVLGYIQCPRKNKFCGMWKVYGDANRAAQQFDEYTRCREFLLVHIYNGDSILNDVLPNLAG